jgi:hypothetical protein
MLVRATGRPGAERHFTGSYEAGSYALTSARSSSQLMAMQSVAPDSLAASLDDHGLTRIHTVNRGGHPGFRPNRLPYPLGGVELSAESIRELDRVLGTRGVGPPSVVSRVVV